MRGERKEKERRKEKLSRTDEAQEGLELETRERRIWMRGVKARVQ